MKTILVLLDGLNYRVAHDAMGYLQAECAAGRGRLYLLESELPSLSRPLYECILTGVTPVESGVVHNHVSRLSHQQSVFHYARAAGLTTAAAAYHWFSGCITARRSTPRATAIPTRLSCQSSTGISITTTAIPTAICSTTPKACACVISRTFCWSIR